jgi:hypothetical protein
MKRVVLLGAVLLFSSCGYKQNIVSMTISPSSATLVNPGTQAQFTATGFYNHPYAYKDITKSVTWATDGPQIIGFIPVCSTDHMPCSTTASCATAGDTCAVVPGLVTALNGCGTVNLSATLKTPPDSVMIQSASVTVKLVPPPAGCP